MRKITFAVYSSPKEGLPYLAVMIAPNGDVAAAAAYKTAVYFQNGVILGTYVERPDPGKIAGSWRVTHLVARNLQFA
jgi:hypothetical protein